MCEYSNRLSDTVTSALDDDHSRHTFCHRLILEQWTNSKRCVSDCTVFHSSSSFRQPQHCTFAFNGCTVGSTSINSQVLPQNIAYASSYYGIVKRLLWNVWIFLVQHSFLTLFSHHPRFLSDVRTCNEVCSSTTKHSEWDQLPSPRMDETKRGNIAGGKCHFVFKHTQPVNFSGNSVRKQFKSSDSDWTSMGFDEKGTISKAHVMVCDDVPARSGQNVSTRNFVVNETFGRNRTTQCVSLCLEDWKKSRSA